MSITTWLYKPRLLWHAWNLLSPFNLWNPFHSMTNEQLSLRNVVVWEVGIIKNARLDDNGTRERLASTVQGGSAVRAEVRCDLLAGVPNLGDLLWRTCSVVRHCIEYWTRGRWGYLPDSSLKLFSGTMRLLLYEAPLIFLQSRQWHRRWPSGSPV